MVDWSEDAREDHAIKKPCLYSVAAAALLNLDLYHTLSQVLSEASENVRSA
jgi:hypothetical protein